MRHAIVGAVLGALLGGCVSFGVECKSENVNGWVRVRRFAIATSAATTENLAKFKERVCR